MPDRDPSNAEFGSARDQLASVRIEALVRGAVDDNVALANAVGWTDTASDWRVVHAAASVLGIRSEGRLVAQGALGDYGAFGTIAKMVVAPEAQRGGLGARLLGALMASAESRGISTLGLVATPFGQPLYAREGFEVVGEVFVLMGRAQTSRPDPAIQAGGAIQAISAYDARRLGCKRERMLVARALEATASMSLAVHDAAGQVQGYALATPQHDQWLVGPIIAETEELARALFTAIAARAGGTLRVDVPGEQASFRRWLQASGLIERGARAEMARGAGRLPWQAAQRFALASQAWG